MTIFPLDRRYRKGLADYLARVRWKGSRSIAIAATERALLTDPFAMDLHRNLAGFYYEDGDIQRAKSELGFVYRYLPGWPMTIVVNANPATN